MKNRGRAGRVYHRRFRILKGDSLPNGILAYVLENNKDVEILKEGPSSVVAFGNELEEVAENDEKCVIAADFNKIVQKFKSYMSQLRVSSNHGLAPLTD